MWSMWMHLSQIIQHGGTHCPLLQMCRARNCTGWHQFDCFTLTTTQQGRHRGFIRQCGFIKHSLLLRQSSSPVLCSVVLLVQGLSILPSLADCWANFAIFSGFAIWCQGNGCNHETFKWELPERLVLRYESTNTESSEFLARDKICSSVTLMNKCENEEKKRQHLSYSSR